MTAQQLILRLVQAFNRKSETSDHLHQFGQDLKVTEADMEADMEARMREAMGDALERWCQQKEGCAALCKALDLKVRDQCFQNEIK